ncbi:unnamed protein product [Adineta steineri]|uniref:Glycoside hydrolase family 5 domain-containing protein n=2 Tax=Adineta steineri TaxID=433720 RepID=A0A813MYK3_9BILA|nr:unnamed protein product [Adineta steineri]CAF0849031.1 unnamed protein product [Adineta steineri]
MKLILLGTSRAWSGANSFFAWTLPQDDQITLINTLRAKNVRVIRIFLATIDSGQAGSRALAANDIERNRVGSPYTDSDMLVRVDQFIKNVDIYGGGHIKLIIALHDRYSLGCYAYKADGYVSKYGIPSASACSPPNDASKFYSNEQAKSDFVARLKYLLDHINPHFGQRWGSLNRIIFSFQTENESQGHMSIHNARWMCDINTQIRSSVNNGILLSTGGDIDYGLSLRLENFQCSALDLISLHDYSMNGDYSRGKFQEAIQLAQQYRKRVYIEEFGGKGDTQMAQALNIIGATAHQLGLPWLVWQVVPNARSGDFEFFTNDRTAWAAFEHQAYWAQMSPSPFQWPEIWS